MFVQRYVSMDCTRGRQKNDKIYILGCIEGHLPQPKRLTTRSRWGAVVFGLTLTASGSVR